MPADALELDWLFLVVAAPFVGSFLGVIATRLPAGESAVFGRSACPQCHHQLSAPDLVPMLSWILQRGRCRYCAAPIETFYPLMEIGALLVAISAVATFSGWLLWVSCGFGWTLLTIAAIDYRYLIIPDEISLPLVPVGLGVSYLIDPNSIAAAVAGVVAGFVAFFIIAWLYRRFRGRDGLGMGDAKLLAASGSWVSVSGLPSVVFLAAATGLLVVLVAKIFGQQISSNDKVPFGLYLCLGTWLVWLLGPLLLT